MPVDLRTLGRPAVADDPHGNAAHSETFAVDGDTQPPENHDNTAHSETFAVDGDTQPPEEHDNDAHARDFVDAEEAADAAPVQSVGGSVGNVTVGGALFEETESVELLIQWDNFLNGEESAFEGYMENEDQSDNIVSSDVAMELVFDYDQRAD